AGMLAPYSEELPDAAMLAFCRDALGAYPAFVDELHERTGVDARFRRHGTLHVALDDESLAALRLRAATYAANGGEVSVLDRTAALAREPLLAKDCAGAVFVANEAQVDNRRLGRALTAACEGLGVRIERAEQLALEADSRRVRGLRTPRGFAPASTVVNAAGAWSGSLDGVPPHVRIPVRPIAGEMLALAVPAGAMHALLWLGHRYLVPRDDGRLLVGATVEDRGFDARVTAAGIHDLLDAALAVAPALASFAIVETWAGLRPGTPDGRPFLGETALAGYFVASGHYRNGILLAPASARLIASAIADDEPVPDAFSPRRVGEVGTAAANPAG
ncbi:MAG TPA: glycine oxidase ThiO, partial [Candidatus Elarobacter sp.]